MAKGRTEKDIKKACIDYLRARGHLVIPIRNVGIKKPDGKFIPAPQLGVPDIVGIRRHSGIFFAVECKREKGGVVSEHQKAFIEMIKKHGGTAIVARGVDDCVKSGL